MTTPSVLFVCLGNICRSPLAEGAMRAQAQAAGMAVRLDSAGTGGWHAGDAPDLRAQATAVRHGTDISDLRARQVRASDFLDFDHIIAMDSENLADLRHIAPPDATAQLSLMLDHVPERAGKSVADPYYGQQRDFETTWADVSAGARGLLQQLARPGA